MTNKPAPFEISAEAAAYIVSFFRKAHLEGEPALIRVFKQGETRDENTTWAVPDEHYQIAFYQKGTRPNSISLELCGFTVSIIPETLELLRGKKLIVQRYPGITVLNIA